jgi:D-glucosaminate-6-phosphate ammonia-lyase
VEFGTDEKTTRDDLERAIGAYTAAVHYYAVEQAPDPGALSLEDTLDIARDRGVPVMVDSAGQIYPLENLGKYVSMGADFQCIAAKYMGAPQSTGLALGTEEMIRKLSLHSFVSYEGRRVRGIGRPQKIDRQEIVGVVAAVRRWVTMDHEERLADAEQKTRTILAPLQGIPGVTTRFINNVTGISVLGVVDRLKAGDPPIWTRVREGESWITIHVFGLREGEDRTVGERIAAIFGK